MTLLSYSSGGSITGVPTIREDLANQIVIMSRNDTPLTWLIGAEPATQNEFDWLVDEIETPDTVRAKREGDLDPLVDDTSSRVRLSNGIYHDHTSVTVSDQYRRMDEAAVSDEYLYQLAKTGIKFAKQQEQNLRFQAYAQGSAGSAGQTAGLFQWAATSGQGRNVTTNPTIAGRTFSWTYGSTWTHLANGTALSESLFMDTLQDAYIEGLNINETILLAGAAVKRLISEFGHVYNDASSSTQPLQQYTMPINERMKVLTIDKFVSDVGTIHMALDPMGDRTTNINITEPGTARTFNVRANNTFFLFNPSMVKRRVLVPFRHKPLADNHLTTRGALTISQGFQVDNPIAIAGMSNINGTQPSIA